MEIKKAVELVEKKTGIDLPDEKIEKTVSQQAPQWHLLRFAYVKCSMPGT